MSRHGPWLGVLCAACSTAGSNWIAEPLTADSSPLLEATATTAPPPLPAPARRPTARYLDQPAPSATSIGEGDGGRSLGTFRNTYYDFPSEADFTGENVTLRSRDCKPIAAVARGFFEAVCVQGSGTLRRGSTVSFARRDCDCADSCPRTGQKICFDELDPRAFPWGRGATGSAITPLLTVAVDSSVIPLGTALYVPELDGLPRDASGTATHDGCFVAQDRGLRVVGKHIDVFTGDHSITALWNQRVPSNVGVTVVVDSPHCARAE